MKKLTEWLEDSIEQMEVVKGMLPSDNAGHIEALGRQKAYNEVIKKIKEQGDENESNI
ncbi:hypothetical protein RV15_GL002151 [Enterococcus silesiacus]|uniref:Uncharacterized protein n=1 Tax=Enterococcus silesiacus TaxID=332949 RepID=A0AA91JQP1_9ENTE|nr:hypothetical protein [Enterococcus silesiacus]OJG93017.1 hypothetical protein RV15_GL002151 [Enterococcus silesiacus]